MEIIENDLFFLSAYFTSKFQRFTVEKNSSFSRLLLKTFFDHVKVNLWKLLKMISFFCLGISHRGFKDLLSRKILPFLDYY